MPTENRSSNTEQMVSVPRELVENVALGLERIGSGRTWVDELRALLAQPAAQYQSEPGAFEVDVSSYSILLCKTQDKAEKTASHYRALGHAVDIRPLYRHSPTSDGFSAGDMADQGAKAFASRDGEVEQLRAALKFYADRDHFSEDMRSDWDSVSGEPANILWHESEAWFVEDGSIARAALERQP